MDDMSIAEDDLSVYIAEDDLNIYCCSRMT